MEFPKVTSCIELMELIQQIGFLPLYNCDIDGFTAEEMVDEECRYQTLPDGGWEWMLWKWKGPVVSNGNCAYGKFLNKKAAFISMDWWPDFCNYRRSKYPPFPEDSVEGAILDILKQSGAAITRELRAACGFNGANMRSKFDGYLTRLEMGTYIVTEDFVYPKDKNGHDYGWGWSLLTTPEVLFGRDACCCERTPEESYKLIYDHLKALFPNASEKQILRLIG